MPNPRICLSMIVQNEAHVIERCLRSVRPFVSAWAICDTGSTDGTQDIIRRVLCGIPGELAERPWVDFAHNRNEALELAAGRAEYALFIDADDVLETSLGFALGQLSADGYYIEFVQGDNSFQRPILVRLGAGWRWVGVLHEVLVGPQGLETQFLRDVRVREYREGARSRRPAAEKYASDAAILAAALEREPANARYAFYLAQSLRDAGRLDEAKAAYERRIAMGGWDEEVFFSRLQVALLLQRLDASDGDICAAYLEAYNSRPTRGEPFCYLARHFRETRRYPLAKVFARLASDLPRPNDILFVDSSVYEWRAKDELSIACYWTGEKGLSARLCRELMASGKLPQDQVERVKKNLQFATT